jgi:DNA-binding NtrC family response regulator
MLGTDSFLRALRWFRHSGRNAETRIDCDVAKTEDMAAVLHVLAIGIAGADHSSMKAVALAESWQLISTETLESGLDVIAHRRFSIILLDREVYGSNWRGAIEHLTKAAPGSCILLVSAVNDEYLWREVVQHGGFDVISKPLNGDQLRRQIYHASLFWKSNVAENVSRHRK